jgi:hypothetical protein
MGGIFYIMFCCLFTLNAFFWNGLNCNTNVIFGFAVFVLFVHGCLAVHVVAEADKKLGKTRIFRAFTSL